MTTYDQWKTRPPEEQEPEDAGEPEPIYARQPDGSTLICATQAECCPDCKRMAYFLVNRSGRTTCAECAS